VHLKLTHGPKSSLWRLGPVRVATTPALMADLKQLLGPSGVGG
jgi:hypothetical protein